MWVRHTGIEGCCGSLLMTKVQIKTEMDRGDACLWPVGGTLHIPGLTSRGPVMTEVKSGQCLESQTLWPCGFILSLHHTWYLNLKRYRYRSTFMTSRTDHPPKWLAKKGTQARKLKVLMLCHCQVPWGSLDSLSPCLNKLKSCLTVGQYL